MEKRVRRQPAVDARNRIEHAIFHLKQAGSNPELDAGLTAVLSAFEHLKQATLDVVYASTGAEYDEAAPGYVRVGVTAHCSCGNVFGDDVRAIAPAISKAFEIKEERARIVAACDFDRSELCVAGHYQEAAALRDFADKHRD